jgi:hypothetical protein
MSRVFDGGGAGETDYLYISSAFDGGDSPKTYFAWVKLATDVLTDEGGIIGTFSSGTGDGRKHSDLYTKDNSNIVRATINGNPSQTLNVDGSPLNPGIWTPVAFRWDGQTSSPDANIKVNVKYRGDQVTTSGAINTGQTTTNETRIGCLDQGPTHRRFHGKIAHAAIWDSELSDAEMELLFKGITPDRISTRPSVYWPLTTRKLCDYQNKNTLTVVGTVEYSNDNPPIGIQRIVGLHKLPEHVDFVKFKPPEPVRPFKFNGTDEAIYTTISVDGDVPTSRAFSLWFKANSYHEGVIAVICIPGTSYDGESNTKIQVHDNGKIQFKEESTPIKSDLVETGYYEPGIWYHVAGVEFGNDVRSLWINGIKQYADPTARGYNTVATRLYVGCDNRTTNPNEGQFFDGEVQDVAFWHGELSQGIIQDLANGAPPEKYNPKYLINNLDNEVMDGGAITKLAGTESYAPKPDRTLTQRKRTIIAPMNKDLPDLARFEVDW